jgi:uncharacterized membrane protein
MGSASLGRQQFRKLFGIIVLTKELLNKGFFLFTDHAWPVGFVVGPVEAPAG